MEGLPFSSPIEWNHLETIMNLQELKDNLAMESFGISLREAWEKGICIDCRQEALPNCYSDAGEKEYRISGLCEKCFDELFKE
jgi:hypothetical protein